MSVNEPIEDMLCNTETLSKIFGVTTPIISYWIKDGLPVHSTQTTKGSPKRFYIPDCIEWKINSDVRKSIEKANTRMDLQQETAKKCIVQTKILELELQAKRDSLITVEQAENIFAQIVLATVAKFQGLPDTIYQAFSEITTPEILRNIVEEHIRNGLEELATGM